MHTLPPYLEDEYLDWDAGMLTRRAQRLGPEQREAVRRHLQHSVPPGLLDYFSTDPGREAAITRAIRDAFERGLARTTRQHPLPHIVTPEFVRDVYDDVVGLGPLEPLLREPRVTSLSVLNWRTILIERSAERERHAETFRDQAHLEQVADNLAVLSGYALSLKVRPRMTHFSVDPPARIHIDVSAVGGPFIGFRRGRAQPWPLSEFVRRDSMSGEVAELLARLAHAEVPMLIVGPPGAGKTTLLEALIHELPERHLVAIEDGAFELHPDHPSVTHLIVPPRSDDDAGQTAGDMAEAAKSALRKNADQVVYGEIMDGNAGHVIANASSFRFSATTLHGHTIEAALSRFSILAQLDNTAPRSPYVGLDNALVRADISLGFRAVVLCGRLADDRQVVREVAWLDGVDGTTRTAEFKLNRLVTLEETLTPAGLSARWHVRADFALPPPYLVNLQAADLARARSLAEHLTAGAAYEQALRAVQSSDWEHAASYLLQAVYSAGHSSGAAAAAPLLPADVAGLLRKVLERSGLWPALAKQAATLGDLLGGLLRARRWDTLEQALMTLDANVPLALALAAACDLRALRDALRWGREQDAQIAARIDAAQRLASGGRAAEGLAYLLCAVPSSAGPSGTTGVPLRDGLEIEHYQALARSAFALYAQARATLPHNRRQALAVRLDALAHLAGENDTPASTGSIATLVTIQDEANATFAEIARLVEAAPAGPVTAA